MEDKIITTLFLDIGGVLLTNGWDTEARNKAVAHFKLNGEEMNERHHLTLDTYEKGKLTLSEYLQRVIFYKKRPFSQDDFIAFMHKQSVAYPHTLDFFKEIKKRYRLRVIAVSNEGRELNAFRIKEYKLYELFDTFVSSCFVFLRKPDPDIFRMAIDISQTVPQQALYIDDRLLFVEAAQALGLHGIHYQGLETAKDQLEMFGLTITHTPGIKTVK